MRSVPEEISEREVRIKMAPDAGTGTGISSRTIRPFASDCSSCCIDYSLCNPLIAADLNIDETAAPQFKAHERKYRVAAVDSTLTIIVDQCADTARVKEAAAAHYRGIQGILDFSAQLVPQPPPQRRAESALGAIDDVARQNPQHGLLED